MPIHANLCLCFTSHLPSLPSRFTSRQINAVSLRCRRRGCSPAALRTYSHAIGSASPGLLGKICRPDSNRQHSRSHGTHFHLCYLQISRRTSPALSGFRHSGGPGLAPADAFRLLIISICHTAHVCRPALFFHPPPTGIRTSPAHHRGVSRLPPSPERTDSDIP